MLSPLSDIPRRIEVRILRVPAMQAAKHLSPPERLYRSTRRTGDAGVGWRDRRDGDSHQGSQQYGPLCKEACRMLFPADESFRVFQCDASARALSYENSLSGFPGKTLPLRSHRWRAIESLSLLLGSPLSLFLQDRPEVGTSIAIAPRNCRPHPDIAANPALRLCHFGAGYLHIDGGVPLAVLAKDARALTQLCARIVQCSIERTVFLRRQIELTVPAEPLHVDPQVKARCLPRCLYFGCVTEFGLEIRQRERALCRPGGFLRLLVVVHCTIPSPLLELALSGLALALQHQLPLARNDTIAKVYGCSLLPRKESAEHTKHVGFYARRVQLYFVPECDLRPGFLFSVLSHAREWQCGFGQTRGRSARDAHSCPQRLQANSPNFIRTISTIYSEQCQDIPPRAQKEILIGKINNLLPQRRDYGGFKMSRGGMVFFPRDGFYLLAKLRETP